MIRNPLIAQRLFNTPLLIHPAKLDAIIAGLSDRLGIAQYNVPEPSAFTSQTSQWAENGLYRMVGDVAVFDIFGVLSHRGGFQADSSYILGYQTIARQLTAALDDPQVGGIVLNFDSPGGEVAGAFDLAAMIHESRGRKPMQAVASDLAASAAYLNAAAAGSIAVTQNAYIGSIGVVMRHVDFSQALASEGIRVTHIFAGARKVDGNPFEPLPDAVREQFQGEITALYDGFVAAVAGYRGMNESAIRATEAGIYRGQAAIDAGLADRMATPDQVIAEMQSQISARASRISLPKRKTTMSKETNADAVYTQSDLDQARAEGHAAGKTEGMATGTLAERQRALGILTHADAEGRTAQAIVLVDTDLSAESAGKILAASSKISITTHAGPTAFERHMAALGNPPVGVDQTSGDSNAELIASGVALLPANRRAA